MGESDKESAPGLPSSAASASSIPHLLPDEAEDADGLYKYRDFSNVAEEDDDASEMPPSSHSSRGHMESSIRVQKFPVKLYAILAQKEFQDIITWMPHGRSWKVLKPNLFETMVMPLFFEYSNYHSFNRLVNAWSFRRISSGPDRGSYYHELFLRGKPHLQKYMRRLPKTHKKQPMKKTDEPDFYALDKTNPLPALEDAPVPGAIATSIAMRAQQHPQMHGGHSSSPPQHSNVSCPTNPHHSMHPVVTPPHPQSAMEAVPQRRGGPPPPMYPTMYPPGGHALPQEEYEYEMPFQPTLTGQSGPPRHGMSYPNISSSTAFASPMPPHQMHHPPMDGPPPKYGAPPPAVSPQSYRPMEHNMYANPGADSERVERSPPTQEEYFQWQQQQIKRMKHMNQMQQQQQQQQQHMPPDYPEQQEPPAPNPEEWLQHRQS